MWDDATYSTHHLVLTIARLLITCSLLFAVCVPTLFNPPAPSFKARERNVDETKLE